MYNRGSNPVITGCTFENNYALVGGGIENDTINSPPAYPAIENSYFCGNQPDHINGDWGDYGGNTFADECSGDPVGACCVGTSCSTGTAADCSAAGGTYLGDGSSCSGDPCSLDCPEDINGDGLIQYVGPDAMGADGAPIENELTIDRDIIVLANPEIAHLPNWVVALVAAGGLAAALSTAAGLLLVVSSAISHDLLKRALMPDISEKHELLSARIAAALAVVVAGYLGIHPPGFVGQVVAFAFGLAASSFFPVIIMGIFSKRMNRQGAVAGMTVGLLFTASYIAYFRFIAPELDMPENWWFGISPEGIGTLGMLFNFIISTLVSKVTAPPPKEIQDLVDEIRVPRGAGAS